jgi:hypothetical protein
MLATGGVARAQAPGGRESEVRAPDPRWGRATFDTSVAGAEGAARLALRDGVLHVRNQVGSEPPPALVLPLALVAEADTAIRARVFDARRRDGTLYVVVLVLGRRRPGPGDDGRCPDAMDLVWLAVAPGPTLAASRSVPLQNCLALVRPVAWPDLSPPPAFEGQVLRVGFEIGPPWTPRWVVYDRRRPERGLTGNYAQP